MAASELRLAASTGSAASNGFLTLARNVGTRYVLIAVNVAIGLVVLPYNVHHLGSATYGLWMLAASITSYFSVLDFGYGGAIVKFVAEFRVKRDARALNEVLSTMAYVFMAIGVVTYLGAMLVAGLLPHVFNLQPGQEQIGRIVLLVIAAQMALSFAFSVYGAVVNGFEQFYLNSIIGLVSNIAAAVANVLILWLGYGLVELVIATTVLRIIPLWFYRRNAYAVFPELRIGRDLFRRDRLRELTRFGLYFAAVDWAAQVAYTTDSFYLGIFLSTAAVGVYAIAQRLCDALLHLTLQLHGFLLPAVVQRAVGGDVDRQQSLMVKATRLQLAVAVCLCGAVAATADTLIRAWVGPGWDGSVAVTQLLALTVVLRALIAMPMTVLQGSGHHKYVAGAMAASAIGNVALSIPLVQWWGLVGVTVGTAVPLAVCAVFILVKCCRVVDLPIWRACQMIAWPTLWPGAVAMLLLFSTRQMLPSGLIPALAHLGAGAAAYVVLFISFGLPRDERQWLVSEVRLVLARRLSAVPSPAA